MAVKTLLEEGEVVGTVILVGGEVKRRVRGKSEVLKVCKMERERVEALERWFGIDSGQEEVRGIKGMVTELQG